MSYGASIGTGASIGSSLGGVIGTAILPGAGTAVGSGIGAGAGAGVGAIAEYASRQAIKKKQRKLADLEYEKANDARRQAVRDSMEMSGQQVGQAQNTIARDSLGATGTRDMGRYVQAQGAVAGQQANLAARSSMNANQMAQQQADARLAAIYGRMDTRQAAGNADAKDAYAAVSGILEMLRDEYGGDKAEGTTVPSTPADASTTPMLTDAQKGQLDSDYGLTLEDEQELNLRK